MQDDKINNPAVKVLEAIEAGRDAWGRVKKAAKMMREDWRRVGEALLIGRRLHQSDKLFGRWCRANGFGDMDRRVRADAMWLAMNWTVVGGVDNAIMHPTHIRAAEMWLVDNWAVVQNLDNTYCRPTDIHTAAIWLVENWAVVTAGHIDCDICHPHHIRVAYNASRASPRQRCA